jgi:hypothetical protein
MQDPELGIDRALEQYLRLGYSENWINQRLRVWLNIGGLAGKRVKFWLIEAGKAELCSA